MDNAENKLWDLFKRGNRVKVLDRVFIQDVEGKISIPYNEDRFKQVCSQSNGRLITDDTNSRVTVHQLSFGLQ